MPSLAPKPSATHSLSSKTRDNECNQLTRLCDKPEAITLTKSGPYNNHRVPTTISSKNASEANSILREHKRPGDFVQKRFAIKFDSARASKGQLVQNVTLSGLMLPKTIPAVTITNRPLYNK